jgi:hypothetical protein
VLLSVWGAVYRARGENEGPCGEEGSWQEGAGGLLLLAAAAETDLLPTLMTVLPATHPDAEARLPHVTPTSARMLLLTLLFLGVVGLRRTWDLRSYTGAGLAVLTGRRVAYGYRHVERFLAEVAASRGAESLTEALACWTSRLWLSPAMPSEAAPVFAYIDGHRKPVYTDGRIPRGLIGRTGAIEGCRALVLLHDAQGHPLLATTHRGDQHLTVGLPQIVARYAQALDAPPLTHLVVDREGMSGDFLAALVASGCTVVTLLRADQYAGLAAFTDVGPFVPLSYDRQGHIVREVAPARFALPVPSQPATTLSLSVGLIRDLRCVVPVPPAGEEDDDLDDPDWLPPRERWLAGLPRAARRWWDSAWVATAAPASPTQPKLIPIVSTADAADAVALARLYTARWPEQENIIRDWLLPLGLDTNHGYRKAAVENSEVAKQRALLEDRRDRLQRWADSARQRYRRAQRRGDRLHAAHKARGEALYRDLNQQQDALVAQGVADYLLRRTIRERKADIDADLRIMAEHAWSADRERDAEWRKIERYCQEQRTVLRHLEDLTARAQPMYELDNAKDQVMTILKLALTNLAMWTRDQYFPTDYAHATWHRLAPFFRLPGRIVWGPTTVQVTLRPFNDRQLTRDLALLCQRVQAAPPHLPDGRQLVLTLASAECPAPDMQNQAVA